MMIGWLVKQSASGKYMNLKTVYDPPPIPLRRYDWSATTEDYEPGDPIGLGRTEQEAVADLMAQLDGERDE